MAVVPFELGEALVGLNARRGRLFQQPLQIAEATNGSWRSFVTTGFAS
jgi:hypothetical protein